MEKENLEKNNNQSLEENLEKSDEKNNNQSLEENLENQEDTSDQSEKNNGKKELSKEKDDAFEYGGFAFARESLNLIDNLERSKLSLENDEEFKNTEILQKVIDHLNVINKDILSIFKKNNIEPIKSINQKLDPNLHQAMMEIEDDSKEPGTIIQEIQKGFVMKDRLLRPSLVGVSKKKLQQENSNKKSEENKEKKEEN